MWKGLQSITDYKKKTGPVADQDVLLPDKLNNFFPRLEDNTVPPTWPATKTCGLSFTAANMSKTFKLVNLLVLGGSIFIFERKKTFPF